jgi:hypothetical protein
VEKSIGPFHAGFPKRNRSFLNRQVCIRSAPPLAFGIPSSFSGFCLPLLQLKNCAQRLRDEKQNPIHLYLGSPKGETNVPPK